ncbi:hypothetical protein GCM10025789_30410 [Tessaracoccus lubricantis]|uniref:HTH lysR-type domain-containing protein n=1 Tax=Tessaracoccus lubricantis TaxID=545543 RepID=A0ABP9FQY3_9ACTN
MANLLEIWTTTRLRLMVELERCGSLSQAAEKVGLSQPSASEHIRIINRAAGEPVVVRNGRTLALSPAGRMVAAYAAHALSNLVAGESALAARIGLRAGSLRLAASSVPGTYIVPDVLVSFQEEAPDVSIEFSVGSTAEVRQWILSGRASCAVTCGDIADDRLKVSPVGPDDIKAVAQPGLLALTSMGQAHPSQLDKQTLLVQEFGSSTRNYAQQILEGTTYRFRRVWELGSVDAVKRAARQGSGIAFLSTHTVVEERRRGELITFDVLGVPKPSRRVNVVRATGSPENPAERFFESLLRAQLSAHTQDGSRALNGSATIPPIGTSTAQG